MGPGSTLPRSGVCPEQTRSLRPVACCEPSLGAPLGWWGHEPGRGKEPGGPTTKPAATVGSSALLGTQGDCVEDSRTTPAEGRGSWRVLIQLSIGPRHKRLALCRGWTSTAGNKPPLDGESQVFRGSGWGYHGVCFSRSPTQSCNLCLSLLSCSSLGRGCKALSRGRALHTLLLL